MSFADLEFDFHVAISTVAVIIREICNAIWEVLQPLEMPEPDKKMWLTKAEEFYEITNFPNCVGALDGKHIRVKCPPNTGSQYFNYKKYFSVVLLAAADAKYFFIFIDVGAFGREGDSSIFKNSNFGQRLMLKQLDLPQAKPLPLTSTPALPHVFVGDEAFGLNENLMRPFPSKNLTDTQRVYNYRHSRARRVVECSFGILSNKWRVLQTCISVHPEFVNTIVQCCCVLHNFVRRRDGFIFEETLSCDMVEFQQVASIGGRSSGISVREEFLNYFNGHGAVPWQSDRL